MKDMLTSDILQYPTFWITAPMLVFFSGTFVLSISYPYLLEVLKDDAPYFWIGRNFFRTIFCLVACYGLWLDLHVVKEKQRSLIH